MINLGKLKEVKDLRKVWPHEALDFTPWLAEDDNLALLADAVGLEITLNEKGYYPPILVSKWLFTEQKNKQDWLESYKIKEAL